MNDRNTVNYIGVTNNLERRVDEHRTGAIKGFTWQYNVKKLVYYEPCDTAEQAIVREKQLKNWRQDWKVNLIRQQNPEFRDLFADERDPETSSG
jgi:putative endonuclease